MKGRKGKEERFPAYKGKKEKREWRFRGY